jgi:hypothetical protein
MRKPDFFIVGAPKCGTTAMYRWLKAHPEIFVPVKEIHHFGKDLDHRRPPVSAERYAALFSPATSAHKALGDVGVWYLLSTDAADEIYQYAPQAKIIIMLRRPVEMLYSLHSQLLYSGEEDLVDFGAALEAEAERAEGHRIPHSTHRGLEAPPSECLLYSRVGAFAAQVERYLSRFEQVHVVLHDDIVNDPAEVFRGVLDFLEVDSSFKADFSVVNPNTTVKSQAMRRVIQGMWFGPLREFAPAAVRGVGRRMFERLQAMNTQTQARAPLDEAVRQRLKSALSADVDELRTLINRPLEGWSC